MEFVRHWVSVREICKFLQMMCKIADQLRCRQAVHIVGNRDKYLLDVMTYRKQINVR